MGNGKIFFKERVFLNYWVTPFLLTIIFGLLSIICLNLDTVIYHFFLSDTAVFIHRDSAQTVLSTIASSIITVTAVVFSITVLILSIATNQLGPRLIPNFLKQGKTQLVVGLFIGSFLYCLVILCTINSSTPTPHLSIFVGICLGVICFLVLIYFIHYICRAIQVDVVLEDIAAECKAVLLKDSNDNGKDENLARTNNELELNGNGQLVRASSSGYLRFINLTFYLEKAQKHDAVVHFLVRPGHFVKTEQPIIKIHTKKELSNDDLSQLSNGLIIGVQRTSAQDVTFLFEQMAEIGLRALSPGINNPYTAILCMEYIAECLIQLCRYEIPKSNIYHKSQKWGVILKRHSYEGIIKAALDRLRQQALTDLSVSIKFMQIIYDILDSLEGDLLKPYLVQQAKTLYLEHKEKLNNDYDLEDLNKHYERINKFLK